MPPTTSRSKRSPGDHTGRQSEALAREAARRADQGAISTTQGPLGGEEIIVDERSMVDLTNPSQPVVRTLDDDDLEADDRAEIERQARMGNTVVEVGGVQVTEQTRLMRVAEACNPTIGFGPNGPFDYEFVPGPLYKVPAVVYDHLDACGYVYH